MSEQMTEEIVDQHHDPADGVESEGLNANAFTWMVIVSLVVLLAVVFAVVEVARIQFQEARTEAATVTGYPTLQETRIETERLLSNYEVIDFENSIYRIPIDRAMELVVAEASAAEQSTQ